MHDDEFGDEEDVDFEIRLTGGKILPSGITPEDVGPAEYALPPGVPALQSSPDSSMDSELEEIQETAPSALVLETPRSKGREDYVRAGVFVATGAFGALLLVSGIAIGWALRIDASPTSPKQIVASVGAQSSVLSEMTGWAHELAGGEISKLWADSFAFLAIVDQQEVVSRTLWIGVERLVIVTLAERSNSRWRRVQSLIYSIERVTHPKSVDILLHRLKSLDQAPGDKR